MRNQTVDRIIYLDNAASTPIDPAVLSVIQPILQENYGNPSSLHQIGRRAYDTLNEARQSVARSLAVDPNEIIFTGSGTESDNLAILGLARAHRQHGNHIIISAIEHKAVLAATKQLETEGFAVTYLPVDEYGRIRIEDLLNSLTAETILVSIMYANNEIGTTQPITLIAETIHEHYKNKWHPIIHTDACQAVGMLPVAPRELRVDAMTINSAKIYGPKGVGLLYLKAGTALSPLIVGGEQEWKLRAGTENIALIAGFAKALELAITNTKQTDTHLTALRDEFITDLKANIPTLFLNGHPTKRLPNNINICIPDIEGESTLLMLDAYGICASTGSACSAHNLDPSHVLTAIGLRDDVIHGSLRFSLGKYTTKEDLDYTVKCLTEIHQTLLALSASPVTENISQHDKHS